MTKEQIDDLYAQLVDRSIELVEGERHKYPPHEQPALAEDELPAAPKLDLSVEPSLDSLRLQLAAGDREGAAADGRPGGFLGEAGSSVATRRRRRR